MILPVVAFGDPVLKTVAKDIASTTDVKTLVANMFETMYAANGVGLAAPQIGQSIRLFVIDSTAMQEEGEEEKGYKLAFINPIVLEESGELWGYEEGCLSIPGIRAQVQRYPVIKIKFFNEAWEAQEMTFDGLNARVIQHELDHIDGKLFIDYISPLRKQLLKGKLADISKGKVDVSYRMKFPIK
jgi:peptide deformylase